MVPFRIIRKLKNDRRGVPFVLLNCKCWDAPFITTTLRF